jgi:hypothetical protein
LGRKEGQGLTRVYCKRLGGVASTVVRRGTREDAQVNECGSRGRKSRRVERVAGALAERGTREERKIQNGSRTDMVLRRTVHQSTLLCGGWTSAFSKEASEQFP